ncbi:MAG: protein phosphatase 2C domain-containing protein [Planctomycetota bacterium]
MGKVTSLVYSDRTDIGRRRSNNQDSKAVLPASPQQFRTRGWLFMVADGMGAHAAGELASAMAAELVPKIYEQRSEYSPPLAMRMSLEQVNHEINTKGESGYEFKGMGTTCTTLSLMPRGAIVGHIGDSRCYRIRGTRVEQLSRDHSLVWELELAGGMSREQAAEAAPKNIITRSMGPHAHVDVDLEGPFPVATGDVFLLCSDGLSGQVSDEEIGLLAGQLEPPAATAALIGLSLVRGAPDNVTVVVARAGEEEATNKSSLKGEAWPLSEETTTNLRQAKRAWLALAVAAVFLLVALMFNPKSLLTAEWCRDSEVAAAICMFGSIAALLSMIGTLLYAISVFLAPTASRGRLLQAGDFLGKGPYRKYDCTPTDRLIEGMLKSIEQASQELMPPDRERTTAITARAREQAMSGAFHESLTAVAEALAIHTRAVEDARGDETIRTPASTTPGH